MSKKKRKTYNREFKKEAVALITEKGYSIAEASRNLGIEYSVLRRWKRKRHHSVLDYATPQEYETFPLAA